MEAYVLVNTEPDMMRSVAEEARKIDGVRAASAVTDQYDNMIHVVFENMEALGELIRKIHTLQGVMKTHTAVVMPTRIG